MVSEENIKIEDGEFLTARDSMLDNVVTVGKSTDGMAVIDTYSAYDADKDDENWTNNPVYLEQYAAVRVALQILRNAAGSGWEFNGPVSDAILKLEEQVHLDTTREREEKIDYIVARLRRDGFTGPDMRTLAEWMYSQEEWSDV